VRTTLTEGREKRLTEQLKKTFDRSFTIVTDKVDGKVRIIVQEQDSGHDFMTVADVAALLQIDRSQVRRMSKARAQRSSRHPIPFFKVHGKLLRFSRAKITEWLQTMGNEKPIFAPAKGKQKR
jgi:excisionase family DNA binding protein